MSVLKRLTTSIYARVDRMVNSIENHDAMVEAAIRETRGRVAGGKARLERVRRDGEALRAKIDQLRDAEAKWTQRAKAAAPDDEANALECLRRRARAQEQRTQLEREVASHAEMLSSLESSVRAAEESLQRQINRYHLMRGRESAADAREAVEQLCGVRVGSDLDGLFERWETRILESELTVGDCPRDGADSFERRFEQAENDEALRAELRALRQGKE